MVIALVALSQPRAFVWCQTETGHAAIEDLEAGCCGVSGPDNRCSPDLASEGPLEPENENAIGGEACRDVLVEAPTCLPPGARLSLFPVAALRTFAVAAAVPLIPGRAESRPDDSARAAARELLLSTVLRV